MLTEALAAVAATGGTAVVQAVGTDAWTSMRARVATLLGRGDEQRSEHELERLDRTATVIANADEEQLDRVRTLQEGTWQARLEDWLSSLDAAEREKALEELRGIVGEPADARSPEGPIWQGDVRQTSRASGNARIYQLGQGEMSITE
ncbi:hypothetical protein ACF07V_11275 [Streptomyces sp. NPDC015661]|uniref:hypothetical protein n=1 Tax=Streptomyces sp. NPDC015661 TaxID=3364961 RepID=UPI0036FC5357